MEGFDHVNQERFYYVSQKVVIATGCTSKPNRLDIPGELTNNSRVVHNFSSVDELVRKIRDEAERNQTGNYKKYLIFC